MGIVSWILWNGEKLGSRLISRIFWPPCSASVVVFDGDEVLVVENDDYLMLPGGLLERGESFQEAARREVEEETGLAVEILDEIDEWAKDFGGVEKVFSGSVTGGELESSWEGDPKFLGVEEAEEKDWRWNRDIEETLEKARRNGK
jgi:8-oxo-dGTP pyrophosphatase MutT (NUDIX family)